jgi:hypothetical protein
MIKSNSHVTMMVINLKVVKIDLHVITEVLTLIYTA